MKKSVVGLGTLAAAALVLSGCGGGGFDDNAETPDNAEATDASIEVLIGSSGEAETAAVESAVAAWSEESGIPAEVIVASDLSQQLSQGFAGGSPADLFYMSADQMHSYAANGSLLPYASNLSNKDDFYPALVEAFSIDGEFYCAPKDFSTLALVINTDMWEEAGLTDADYPTNWDELATVAKKLSKDGVAGLGFGPEIERIGVFMAQAGGGFISEDGTEAIINSEENAEAFNYVKQHLEDGSFAYSSDLGAGWGGEAFGKGLAAMVIEGNWITGALSADFPDVKYEVVELPAGPAGKGTIQYTNCWGIATDADNTGGAQELVEYLTSTDQQLKFAEAFGVMPSVESASENWKELYPTMSAFIDGADYAINLPSLAGSADVIADMNAQITSLKTADVAAILESSNTTMQSVLDAQ